MRYNGPHRNQQWNNQMNIFTVENGNKYFIDVKRIQNIEEAGDDFVTEEEIREMMGDENAAIYNRTYFQRIKIGCVQNIAKIQRS